MEILSGMILLLQVVILIQIMLVGKQTLQRIADLEAKIPNMCSVEEVQEKKMPPEEGAFEQNELIKKEPNLSANKAEALLNEVLSEVFS